MSINDLEGRELDKKMAELMGWVYWDFDFRDYDGKYPMFIIMDQLLLVFDEANKHREFSPSTDIAAADSVIDKMEKKGYSFHLRSIVRSSDPTIYIAHFGDRRKRVAEFTRPLAICRAVLAAEAE